MNFFEAKTSWKNIEFIPFKLCVASAYMMVGAYFQSFISKHLEIFVIPFLVSVAWTVYLRMSKMRQYKNG